jgi:hypothetical protein
MAVAHTGTVGTVGTEYFWKNSPAYMRIYVRRKVFL